MVKNGISDLLNQAIETATRELGHLNVIIAGRTGVGKSTLINAVFQANLAETGQGRPVTQDTREINKEGIPLTIFDTRGLEMSAFMETSDQLRAFVRERCADRDSNRHIHVAWICIQEDGRRVEDAEIALHALLAEQVPVLAVITKARADGGFRQEVQRLLPQARNVLRVRAIGEELDDGHTLSPSGLEELVFATSEIIPEGKRRALAAAQKASLQYKKTQARKVVAGASAAAVAAAATPIPFSDAALLVPVQIGMLAGITTVFGFDVSKSALSTLISSALGVTGAMLAGRSLAAGLLKLFPGAGSIAGATIAASTASAVTAALGEAYITVLAQIYQENPSQKLDMKYVAEKLKEKMRRKSSAEP